MRKKRTGRDAWKAILWITAMIIVAALASIWYMVVSFDEDEMYVKSSEADKQVFLEGTEITEANDSWETVIQQSEDIEDVVCYTGVTCPVNVVNPNKYAVKDWQLTLHIKDECYLSGFWCGSVMVYQYRDNQLIETKVQDQTVKASALTNIDRNIYSDNLMIHLLPGDYLVYFPSVKENEDIIKAREAVGIGFIMYYRDALDLSEWELIYHNDVKLINLVSMRILLAFICVWFGALIMYISFSSMEKRMREQMNLRIRNISIMTDLYIEAYMVDISDNSVQMIKGNKEFPLLCVDGIDVQEKINKRIAESCHEDYREELTAFMNLREVAGRLADTSSIAFEFLAENLKWYAIRIFKVEDDKDQIVVTLSDINKEKISMCQIEERVRMAEYKQNVSGNFLGTVSFALNDISAKVGAFAREIMSKTEEENTRALADCIAMNTRHMNLIQNTMLDLYQIECKSLILNNHEYDIFEMVAEIEHMLKPFSVGRDYDFSIEVDQNIPAKLYGDSDRIEQIIVILLFSCMLMTEKGFVKFSVFGKQHENEEELLFSMRDSAQGFTEQQLNEIYEFINGASIETFDNASLVYHKIINGILKAMGSELKIVSVLDEGSDFYFTLRQRIVDGTESEE